MIRRKAMAARKLDQLLRSDFEQIIEQANLGAENMIIAKLWLLDGLKLADIGARVGYDRSTIGRKLPWILDRVTATADKMQKQEEKGRR